MFFHTFLTKLSEAWRPMVEVLILAVAIYYVLTFVRGSRGWPVFTGFLVVLLTLAIVTTSLDLKVLRWLLGTFSLWFAVAVLVIFQPELRRMLAELGNIPLFNTTRE